ncbi:MAG: Ser-Thr-rich GPI-anchored membrane family protein, partial [bacterium]|nr:Ser-Thr-rich GPI-anchored membrane family protein [bacterium]
MNKKRLILYSIFSAVFLFNLGAPKAGAEWCYNFNINLKLGSRGYEVGALQAALQKEGLLIGRLDGVFGQRTRYALIAFQNKYKEEILTPLRINNGTGFAGNGTRVKLNALYGCSTQSSVPIPIPVTPATSSLAVVFPNGGDQISQGTNFTIKWTASGLDKVDIIIINYVTGDQTGIVSSVSASLGQYSWTVPETVASGNKYKITVKSGKTSDLSDSYFSIVSVKKA